MALNVKNEEDVCMAAEKIYSDGLTPIFEISNVTGQGMDNLKILQSFIPEITR